MKPIDVSPRDLGIVRGILGEHVPELEVRAFGSRVAWTAREMSDLDLVVMTDAPLPLDQMADLKEAFVESDLPYKVDVVDWAALKVRFRRLIQGNCVVLEEAAAGVSRSTGGAWRRAALGDVIELKRGYDLPRRERTPGSVPIVSSSGVTDFHGESKVKGPGVVTGRYGTLGKVFFVTEDFWPLNTALYVRDFKGNDPRFIGYFLRELDFFAYSDKAAVPGLNRNHLHQAAVRLPTDVYEQRVIAHVLGTLDDKIELNRRMSETLEAQAAALFKSWFVDFDPVRAKAEGRDTGLPKSIADLFPYRLVDSELGQVPEGWEVGTVGDLAGLSRISLKPGEFPEEVFDHYSIPAYDRGRMPNAERGEAIKSNKLLVLLECVLLSKLNPRIPRVWLPNPRASRRSLCSTEFLVTVPRRGLSRDFLYCLFSSDAFISEFSTLVTGTSGSHQRVRPQAMLALALVLPPGPLVQRFAQVASGFLHRVANNRRESRSLTALRDTLLPKLISGDLRVPDAERVVARTEA